MLVKLDKSQIESFAPSIEATVAQPSNQTVMVTATPVVELVVTIGLDVSAKVLKLRGLTGKMEAKIEIDGELATSGELLFQLVDADKGV